MFDRFAATLDVVHGTEKLKFSNSSCDKTDADVEHFVGS